MLNIALNYGFAWLSVLVGIILAIKFLARIFSNRNKVALQLNRYLRKVHIPLGIFLVVVGFVHGMNSSESVLSINLGTVVWLLSILLGINYLVRAFLTNKGLWIRIHRALTVMFLCGIIFHVIDVGGIQLFNVISTELNSHTVIYEIHEGDKVSDIDTSDSDVVHDTEPDTTLEEFNDGMQGVELSDGTYTGIADGFGKNLTVSVTIEANRITDIVITSHNERQARFYERPMKEIPTAIIDTQSLDVDVISGATYTSVGIINAVNDALKQALVSGELPAMKELPRVRR